MTDLIDRITPAPEQCGGRPGARGMRMRVVGVLDLLAAGWHADRIPEELPDLEMDDIKAVLRDAGGRREDEQKPGILHLLIRR